MMVIPDRKEFTVARAAQVLERSDATVYRWIDEGYLKVERRPKNRLIVRREFLVEVLQKLES